MSILDGLLLSLVGSSIIWGYLRGLTRASLSLVGWVAGYLLARKYGHQIGAMLPVSIDSENFRQLLGFLLIFVVVMLMATLVSRILRKAISVVGLGLVDRVLGAGFGTLRALLLLLILSKLVNLGSLNSKPEWKNSQVMQKFIELEERLQPLFDKEFGKYLN